MAMSHVESKAERLGVGTDHECMQVAPATEENGYLGCSHFGRNE
jgi:hypothetical protein